MRIRNTAKAALALFICASVVVLPAVPAQANSALDQYVEEVPDTGGGQNGDGNGDGKEQKGKLDPERTKKLTGEGKTGEALLALAATSGPSDGGSTGGPTAGDEGNGTAKADRASVDAGKLDRSTGVSNSLESATEVSGLNLPLFIFVILLAAAMGVTAWYRRARGGKHS